MARPRHKFQDIVRVLIANQPQLGQERYREILEEAAPKVGWDVEGLPSPATIGRIKARFPEAERAPYRRVAIPEVFDTGVLPWEAAAEVLALWRWMGERPTVGLAQRFWHVTLALGTREVPIDHRFMIAQLLLQGESIAEGLLLAGGLQVDEELTNVLKEMRQQTTDTGGFGLPGWIPFEWPKEEQSGK